MKVILDRMVSYPGSFSVDPLHKSSKHGQPKPFRLYFRDKSFAYKVRFDASKIVHHVIVGG